MFTTGKYKNATCEENNPNFTYTVLGSKQNNSRVEWNLGISLNSSTKNIISIFISSQKAK